MEVSHFKAGKSPKNIEKQEKSRNLNDCGICKIWCARRDLNPHARSEH